MATYDAMTRRISLARIDQQSIRGYFQTAELPEHHEREAANKPWRIFEVLNTHPEAMDIMGVAEERGKRRQLPVSGRIPYPQPAGTGADALPNRQ